VCRRCIQRVTSLTTQKRAYHDRWLQHKIGADWEWKERAAEVVAGKRKSMVKMLEERGYIHQVAGYAILMDQRRTTTNSSLRGKDELEKLLTTKRVGAYVGVDPTAPSLHIGHLIPFMALFRMYLEGYGAVTLLGGSTAQYGDPTGRTTEREELDNVQRKTNIAHMHKQLAAIWTHVEALGRKYGYEKHRYWRRALMNNNVWLNKVPVHEVLKLMGGGLRMGSLLSRDS
jgi:tyrosyl-tRNA synthetase